MVGGAHPTEDRPCDHHEAETGLKRKRGIDRMRIHWRFGLSAALLAMALSGCGGGEEPGTAGAGPNGAGKPSGEVIIDGSSTVFRISKAAQEAYSKVNPDVTVVVDNHGTGGGFSRYLQGEVDIVDASRHAKPDEEAKAKEQGIEWTRFLAGYDGITLVVNPKNDFVKSLTVAQLKTIWAPDSKVKTWKDVEPSWPDRKIVLYSPDHDSGTYEFFTEAIVGKARSQREDVQASSDDNTLVNGVSGDPDGLGYFGYAYFVANKTKLRAVPVQNGADAKPVDASPETILDKSYAPLSRPLYLFAKNSAIRRPEVAAFLKYYLDNIETLATKAGYVSPTADDRAANEKALAAAAPKATAAK
jgi:phosphate transport system substrate-binding protein